MIIDCISDLHGSFPPLGGGDLLIVAGDMTANDTDKAWDQFYEWIDPLPYRKKICIAGNHDTMWREAIRGSKESKGLDFEYLCDDGTEFEGLKIWGSPWTSKFVGQNPEAMAFALFDDTHLKPKWDLIPDDTDILITHTPPFGILDHRHLFKLSGRRIITESVGSPSLREAVLDRIQPRLHMFGHIHHSHGKKVEHGTIFVNAAHMNEDYEPVNKPIRITMT